MAIFPPLTEPNPNVELAATSRFPSAALTAAQRSLLREAATANLAYVKNAMFRRASAERTLFTDAPLIPATCTSWYHPMVDNVLVTGAAPRSALLTTAQEKLLFLRYNYSRMRAQKAVKEYSLRPRPRTAQAAALWYGRVRETRDLITQANLGLVLAMIKRIRLSDIDLGELISEGNMALLCALEKFDIGRGFKFSTYACRAIFKGFGRSILKHQRYRQAFPREFDPTMEKSDFQDCRRAAVEREAVDELQRIMGANRAQLSDVEIKVIQARFAVHGAPDAQAMTLEEVGRLVGVTKERVRQIQNKALEKLRLTIESEVLAK